MFTNLTHDHLDFHRSMENYAEAKKKVFKELKETGKAFLNYDDEYCEFFALEGLSQLMNTIRLVKKKLNEILSINTKQPLSKIEHDTERDFYMDANKALEYGIIDEIVKKMC